jgi:hypothetical protein
MMRGCLGGIGFLVLWFGMMSGVMHFAYHPLDASDWGKVHHISCQRDASQTVNCRNEHRGILSLRTEITEFKLQAVTTKEYEASCGEDGTCQYLMVYLETNGKPLEIRDFQASRDRAQFQAARFQTLLTQPSTAPVHLRYGNGAFKIFLLATIIMVAHLVLFPIMLGLLGVLGNRIVDSFKQPS